MTPDTTTAYRLPSYGGVAFRFIRYGQTTQPVSFFVFDDEDDDAPVEVTVPIEIEYETVDNPDISVVCMVGDDRYFYVPTEDLTPIPDGAYCASCGQIGCTHDARASESD